MGDKTFIPCDANIRPSDTSPGGILPSDQAHVGFFAVHARMDNIGYGLSRNGKMEFILDSGKKF